MLNSVYNGNSVDQLQASSGWLGNELDAIQLHGGAANWSDWLSSVGWEAGLMKGVDKQILWSIPLIPYGADLKSAAAGDYDAKYLAMAKQLAANADPGDKIYVRLGWEFNGAGWNSSSAVGQPENYAAAYREFVTVARTVSDKFVFEWCPNIGPTDMNPETAYPGDAYVDVVGLDMYYNTQWDSLDPVQAFNWFVNEPFGLQWQQDFAAAHGKQTAIGEWGLNTDSPVFVKLALQWFENHDMVYQNYWDSNAAFDGQLSGGQYANAAAEFLAMVEGFDANTAATIATSAAAATVASLGAAAVTATSDYTLKAGEVALTLAGTAHVGSGNALDNIVIGNDLGDTLNGNGGNDTLIGGKGNDVLSGGTGADTMVGGAGNDIYHVDNAGDIVIEKVGEGNDTVYASVDNYVLTENVETLYLSGALGLHGTGNALDNLIVGTAGNDVIYGMAGNDTLKGGAGDDALYGGIGNDTLNGNDGNDILDGGAGDDIMDGGTGNDIYYVDSAGDQVIEYYASGLGGTDTVIASIDYRLGNWVENLTLAGTAHVGTGNDLDNVITGNDLGDTLNGNGGNDTLIGGAGNDILSGGTGADTMIGGAGNDIYYVDNLRDVVIEKAGEGSDTVYATVDNYVLADNVETLYLSGTAGLHGTGNMLDNLIVGTAGNDVIYGLAGNDVLKGGAGNDALYGGSGNDTLNGNDGNDILDGGAGDDIMDGGTGNDIYYVDSAGDQVIEYYASGQGGTDTVVASVDYKLGSWVENLTLAGSAHTATGNELDNVITGNALDNVLTGGGGKDRFVFAGAAIGHDTITDFSKGDTIDLSGLTARNAKAPTLSLASDGHSTLIDFGGGNSILLQNVTSDHLVHTATGYSFV